MVKIVIRCFPRDCSFFDEKRENKNFLAFLYSSGFFGSYFISQSARQTVNLRKKYFFYRSTHQCTNIASNPLFSISVPFVISWEWEFFSWRQKKINNKNPKIQLMIAMMAQEKIENVQVKLLLHCSSDMSEKTIYFQLVFLPVFSVTPAVSRIKNSFYERK